MGRENIINNIKKRYERTTISSPAITIIVHHGDCQIFRADICTCGLLHDLTQLGEGMNKLYPKYEEEIISHERCLEILFNMGQACRMLGKDKK